MDLKLTLLIFGFLLWITICSTTSRFGRISSTTSAEINPRSFAELNFRCPIARRKKQLDSAESDPTIRIIKLNEMNGRKVKIQFFYPNPQKSSLSTSRNSAEDLSGEISATGIPVEISHTRKDTNTTLIGIGVTDSSSESETTTEIPTLGRTGLEKRDTVDIMCQWKFLAGNSSHFLLLNFNKMSAPYSDECREAYVSMQKDDGYESRWCGNRRQGNGRPVSLFSHSSATVTVFRRSTAADSPPTGFSVTVESLENRATSQAKDSFRLLVRKIKK